MRLSPHAPLPCGQLCISPRPSPSASCRIMSRRLYGLSGLKLLLPDAGHGWVRSALLAIAGQEDEARAAMQRYLANDKAPFRTMSECMLDSQKSRCRPIIRLFLRVFLCSRRNSPMASEKPDCRSEQRGSHADVVIERAARCMSLMGHRVGLLLPTTSAPPDNRTSPAGWHVSNVPIADLTTQQTQLLSARSTNDGCFR